MNRSLVVAPEARLGGYRRRQADAEKLLQEPRRADSHRRTRSRAKASVWRPKIYGSQEPSGLSPFSHLPPSQSRSLSCEKEEKKEEKKKGILLVMFF
ncbi:hypothetical protein SAY86_005791 [Trapa natans]|uniref:Uncharacterized protein n=1 Tax=Trapa natans TaxID=22666 RepID=A0AAN7KVK0_TRANT|nr:hypothetical protein SAY86_005791 [Trapa natans]